MIPSAHPASFPIYLHLGSRTLHPHLVFETLAYVIAVCVYLSLRRRVGDPIVTPLRWAVIAAAVAGATLGSKLLFWLEDPQLTLHNLNNSAFLIGGKTIVGALASGLLTVELVKRYIGLRHSTGDLYAIPLALGIAIGRIGCFLTGLSDNTYGTPTNLPWGIDFGDGIARHPTQLYEIIFLLALIPFLFHVLKNVTTSRNPVILRGAVTSEGKVTAQSKDLVPPAATTIGSCHFERAGANATASRVTCCSPPTTSTPVPRPPTLFHPGDAFKLFMVAYMSFRLLCDFIKPYPRLYLGLGGIQWACVLILLYYLPDILRWLRLTTTAPA